MKKIAFIGTHGICKTTYAFLLATRLKQEGYHTSIVQEIARKCPLPINEGTSKMAQTWILNQQMKEEIEYGNTSDVVVCDRATIDNLAYYTHSLGPCLEREKFFIEAWIETYDKLVLVKRDPKTAIVEDDGCRSTNLDFQIGIENVVIELLQKYNIEYETIESTYVNQENQIQSILKSLMEEGI